MTLSPLSIRLCELCLYSLNYAKKKKKKKKKKPEIEPDNINGANETNE